MFDKFSSMEIYFADELNRKMYSVHEVLPVQVKKKSIYFLVFVSLFKSTVAYGFAVHTL